MTYFGGKNLNGVYQTLINQIPPHRVYIELYMGSGAILNKKRLAEKNIGVDLDGSVLRGVNLSNVEYYCEDALEFLNMYSFRGDEFVYADPPYLHSSRKSKNRYRYECDENHHIKLLHILKSLPCNVMISGYLTKLYETQLFDWRAIQYKTRDRSGAMLAEYAWMNYSEPQQLHDYSYLGSDFRERERIKRKHHRLKKKIQNLPEKEKLYLINEVVASTYGLDERLLLL